MANRSEDWMNQALRDIQQAQDSQNSERHEWACFAAQQAAEKAVKSLHLFLGQEAWGHVVRRLLEELPDSVSLPTDILDKARVLDSFYIPTNDKPKSIPLVNILKQLIANNKRTIAILPYITNHNDSKYYSILYIRRTNKTNIDEQETIKSDLNNMQLINLFNIDVIPISLPTKDKDHITINEYGIAKDTAQSTILSLINVKRNNK